VKRLFLFLVAGVTGWWAYRQLRSHPRTAGKVADLERQGQLMVNKASNVVGSATGQAASKAVDIAGTAATGAQEAIDTAAGKAHEALDAAAEKSRQAISPVQEKIAELRGDESASATNKPDLERPAS